MTQAMMDDTSDKVRRNLVAFCTAILIAFFLGIKIEEVQPLLLKANIANKERLWPVLLVVWLYLFYRFKVSKSTLETWEVWKAKRREIFHNIKRHDSRIIIEKYLYDQKTYLGSVMFTPFVNSSWKPLPEKFKVKAVSFDSDFDSRLKKDYIDNIIVNIEFDGIITVDVEAELASHITSAFETSLHNTGDYKSSRTLFFQTTAHVVFSKYTFYTKTFASFLKSIFNWEFSEVVFGYLIATSAVAVIVYKLL
ncbi:hypothetical protein UNDKW_2906 [Undibacterium sp. KW1]|uniref:hypothetical protein n=1 Tax=Undibacterium sp. KW1 TaxID=2058624 RepID=UPI001331E765|nr:hypothetical protein [Undibacterium sp. KW1]BBB61179.1 hypothetical protein UNDKW_2906 [Undibacterium sp. KW1]